jgi:hypothetical protein
MQRTLIATAAAAALMATGLQAQTVTALHSPKVALTAANSNNNIPYSWSPTRYQQVFDPGTFDATTPIAMKQLEFRLQSSFATKGYGGQTVELAIWAAWTPTTVTAATASSTFSSNIDSTTLKQVLKKTKVSFPKVTSYAFNIKIPFDSGSTFLYGPALKRSLVIESRNYGNSNNNSLFTYPIEAWSGASAGAGSYKTNGTYTGCKSKSGTVVSHYAYTSQLKVGGSGYYSYGYGYAANIPGLMTLGAKTLNIPMGTTGCTIVNDIITLFPGVGTGTSGYLKIGLPIPNDPKLANTSFLSQFYFIEAGANAWGITSTRGLIQTIGAGSGNTSGTVTRIYAITATPDSATTGSLGVDYGMLHRFVK